MLDFLIKSIDANSKSFSVCIWSIVTSTSSVKSRFILVRSIWLIKCCIMTCSIFAIFRSLNKVFYAFFNVFFIDKINLKILIESNFFLSAICRSFFVFLFLLNNSSSFWIEIDKSIVFISCRKTLIWFIWLIFLIDWIKSIFCSICWLS